MFVKQLSHGKFGVYLDENFEKRLGTAERARTDWYFAATAEYGKKWGFGDSIGDAIRQSGVLEQVHAEDRKRGQFDDRTR